MNDSPLTPEEPVRLTRFSHGGGCGCKIAPAMLQQILAQTPGGLLPPELLVGITSSDDAAVYRVNDEQAIIATTDFFTPVVDDPHDFGRIAAANALSDVYAMGGHPLFALAIVGMPLDKLAPAVIGRILAGGASICREAGIPIAGGHSIDVPEPIYGLVAIGMAHPARIKRNDQARAGDTLILGKPLGIGILSAALKKGLLGEEGYADMLRWTTLLNRAGEKLAAVDDVHAMTDVTGFGLAGHLLEICRGSALAARVEFSRLPRIAEAARHLAAGIATGASARNWASYGEDVVLGESLGAERAPAQTWITDPQTSGGLLVACAPGAADRVLALLRAEGCDAAAVIGELVAESRPRLLLT